MRTTKILAGAALTAVFSLIGTGCAGQSETAAPSSEGGVTTLRVGATFPADDILEHVQETQAEEAGLNIEVTSFSDYVTPNTALEDGSLDANLYQHLPFLNNFNKENGTHIAPVGKVYFPALALYSKKIGSLDEIEDGDTISLPNDPTNELRSLDLLEKAGLITVKDGATGVIGDIATNPRNLEFQELDAATLPRALDDVQAGIVNLTFALPAGLTGDEQIFQEDVEGTLYTNLLATKEGNEDDEAIQTLYTLLTSDETQAWISEEYQGLITPASGAAE
jgi:D-methionine transport system substrate-binding protein